MNDFVKASEALVKQVQDRAKELYPHFNEMWSETTIGYEGGAFCQEDALKEARTSLEAGKTANEWIADKLANRRVVRTFYLSPAEDEALRTLAFRSGKSINDVMVEAIRLGLAEK